MNYPTPAEIRSPLYEERLREAVSADVVPPSEIERHMRDVHRAAGLEIYVGNYRDAAQLLRLAADLSQVLAKRPKRDNGHADPTCYWCDEPADLMLTKEYTVHVEGDHGCVDHEGEEDIPLCIPCYRDEVEGR
jgi:hypothetical protein